MLYKLYHNRKNFKLTISPCDLYCKPYDDDKVHIFNDCYYYCSDRAKLREFAKSLKEKWIAESEEELDKLKNMKIKK